MHVALTLLEIVDRRVDEIEMLAAERRKRIMTLLYDQKNVVVGNLCKIFRVSEETIRRDLDKLEKAGILVRTHGGAIIDDSIIEDIKVKWKGCEYTQTREWIAEKSVKLVTPGNVIMLDASASSLYVAKRLKQIKNITVITNSFLVQMELYNVDSIRLISTGGTLNPSSSSYVDFAAAKFISHYYADISFVSCAGIHQEKAISDMNESEAEMRRIMLQNATQKVLLVDHTKFNHNGLTTIAGFSAINRLITDRRMSAAWIETLDRHHIRYDHDDQT